GAPTPTVAALTTGRPSALPVCTVRASRTPMATGTQAWEVKNSAGSVTAVVCDPDPAPKARPPAVGRTTVWTMSLTWSTPGTLSATTSRTSSTPRIASTQPLDTHSQEDGRSTRLVQRSSA